MREAGSRAVGNSSEGVVGHHKGPKTVRITRPRPEGLIGMLLRPTCPLPANLCCTQERVYVLTRFVPPSCSLAEAH